MIDSGFFSEVGQICRRAWRLATFRSPDTDSESQSPLAVLTVIGLAIAASALTDAVTAGEGSTLNTYGITANLAKWATLAALVILFYARTHSAPISRALADVGAISVYYSLLQITANRGLVALLRSAGTPPFEIWMVEAVYGVLILLIALAAIWHAGRHVGPARAHISGLSLATAALLPTLLFSQQTVFRGADLYSRGLDAWSMTDVRSPERASDANLSQSDGTDVADGISYDYEKVLYDQPALVAHALSTIPRSEGGSGKFYFVAAATDASQEVFRREALGAEAAFSKQFDVGTSSLVLINHRDTAHQFPLASMTNLEHAIKEIGSRMNVENDVLALFITAHGSKELISVNFPGLAMNQMTPDRLAGLLDRAGIKNRVLIISSCYSGSFIPKLAGRSTLIMTAASSETTSFGCSNEREWTYFGDAFFNHALKETSSLIEAFSKAKSLIETWENEQSLPASDPQISAGELIVQKLAAMRASSAPVAKTQ